MADPLELSEGQGKERVPGGQQDQSWRYSSGPGTHTNSNKCADTLSPPLTPRISTPTSRSPSPTPKSHLILLPSELVLQMLSYLPAVDLASVSATCRTLRTHATTDHLWQALIQENVPGQKVTKPYPCPDFRTLYLAHDTRWFLPKYKIWFSDKDLTGRLIIARFDQRRGCIEGYQLVAVSKQREMEPWEADDNITIHFFKPQVNLHLDKPILELHAVHTDDTDRLHRNIHMLKTMGAIKESGVSQPYSPSLFNQRQGPGRYQEEIPMNIGSRDSSFCTYMAACPLSLVDLQSRETPSFPYGNIWPPPTIPSPHRVKGAGPRRTRNGDDPLFRFDRRPSRRSEISEFAFRTRKWFAQRMTLPAPSIHEGPTTGESSESSSFPVGNLPPFADVAGVPRSHRPFLVPFHEEVSTYATLDPKLYTPTKEKPFRGIWVGDYSGHGCEFLLVTQPDDEEGAEMLEPSKQRDGETDEEYEKRKYEDLIYRGKLEAIKLTGDPNVPRGEVTFQVADLGPAGYVKTIDEAPFKGARVVKSMGHIANTGFQYDQFIESQLLIISHDRFAQYWVEWGHISFFERVNIDQFLVPK
ncbi:hypothetical protein QBC43DRAFT_130137 [Cladorrhinum sp. PSN259]|nr:hypothetical protein QBC43DRAFT_130137 [Cladorrhinum sp. PSN259]